MGHANRARRSCEKKGIGTIESVQYTHGEDDLIKRILTYTAV
jgi:hypothetical protein